jgi:dTDP-4-dehydrorhamnose reductase
MSKMTVAVLGANGMLGYALTYELEKYDNIRVLAITRTMFDVDIDPIERLVEQLRSEQVDYCINTIAILNPGDDWKKAIRINSHFPQILSKVLYKLDIKHIHISTNGVFSGSKGMYSENDIPDATDIYGVTKFLGESPYAMVLRTSIIGLSPVKKSGLLEWVISQKNGTIDGYMNEMWNGITTTTLSHYVRYILLSELFSYGVYHIFSNKVLSKFYLLSMINEKFDLGLTIQKQTLRKRNLTLTTIHNHFAYQMPSIEQQLDAIVNTK